MMISILPQMKDQHAKDRRDFLKKLILESKAPDSPSNAIFIRLKLIFIKSFWRKAQLFSVSYKNKKDLKKNKKTSL